MPLFKWKPQYSVNNDVLDSHHQQMFHILNAVYEQIMASGDTEFIVHRVDETVELMRLHIAAEEQYMRSKGSPDIDDHLAKHRDITTRLESLQMSCGENKIDCARNLIILLGEKLLKHVITEDRKYSTSPVHIPSFEKLP